MFLTAGLGCGVRVPTCPCGSREPGPYVEVPCARSEPFCSMHARARKSVSYLLRWVMVAQYRVGPAVCPCYRCVDLVWSRVFWWCPSGGGGGGSVCLVSCVRVRVRVCVVRASVRSCACPSVRVRPSCACAPVRSCPSRLSCRVVPCVPRRSVRRPSLGGG